MHPGKRLQIARITAGMTQAEAVRAISRVVKRDYARSTYSQWEAGALRIPDPVVSAAAQVFKVPKNWFYEGGADGPVSDPPARYDVEPVPYWGDLPCGGWVEPSPPAMIAIKAGLAGPNRFVFRVRGDSMAPRLNPGDYVLAEARESADPGQIVVVLSDDGEMTVKELASGPGGIRVLRSPKLATIEAKRAQIRGRVLAVIPPDAVVDVLLAG